MKEELISFETAKLAKEKGFDISVDGRWWYHCDYLDWRLSEKGASKWHPDEDSFPAPTQSLLQKWLREAHNIQIVVDVYDDSEHFPRYSIRGCHWVKWGEGSEFIKYECKTYEEALEIGLQEALKLINNES
jgi:hypothetical protein